MLNNRNILSAITTFLFCSAASSFGAERVPTPEEFREQVRQYNEAGSSTGRAAVRPVSPQITRAAEQFQRAVTIHNKKDATAAELKEAASLYQSASDGGIPQASTNLAMLYLEGKGVKKDVRKAIKLLEKGSLKDIPQADMALASLYLNGKETKKDEKKGEWHLNKAARTKNPNALKMLADYNDWKKKNELAMKQFQESVKKLQLSQPKQQSLPLVSSQPQTYQLPKADMSFPLKTSGRDSKIPGLFMPTVDQILPPPGEKR